MITYIKAIFISIHCIIIAILTILVSPFDSSGKITHCLSKIFGGVILFIAGVKVITEGKELLDTKPNEVATLEILATGFENSRRKVVILKAADASALFKELIVYYGVMEIIFSFQITQVILTYRY